MGAPPNGDPLLLFAYRFPNRLHRGVEMQEEGRAFVNENQCEKQSAREQGQIG